jgi:predicted patatin/cPLA2 family phospholipase
MTDKNSGKISLQQPLGLVLAGGGALGAWQSGVVYALVTRYGLRFDKIVGISSGSLTGVAYFVDRLDELVSRWKNVNSAQIMQFRPRFQPFSLFSDAPVWKSLAYLEDEQRAQRRAQCHYTVISVCRRARRHIYAHFAPNHGHWDGPLIAHIAASCAIPYVFPPVEATISGQKRLLIDGGVHCSEGMDFQFMKDCSDVLVLEMDRRAKPGQQTLLARALVAQPDPAKLGDAMITNGIQSLQLASPKSRIFRFFPITSLQYSSLEFREKYCVPAFQQGIEECQQLAQGLDNFRVAAIQ